MRFVKSMNMGETKMKRGWLQRGYLYLQYAALIFVFSQTSLFAQETQKNATPKSSNEFIDSSGISVKQLTERGLQQRADLQAARQKLAIAEGKLIQAGLRPNPTLESEYGSPRFVGGESEYDFALGVSQVFETGGKRKKRIAVAELELTQARSEIAALERRFAADVRALYVRAVSAGKQLDTLEKLVTANEEILRITNERLKEGDVAPLDVNLLRVETEKLKVQAVRVKAELESWIISLRALVGMEQTESLRIVPLSDKPPRLELSLIDVTDTALRERADLKAARLNEEIGTAKIKLAQAESKPNIEGIVKFSRNKSVFDLPESLGDNLSIRDRSSELTFGVKIDLPFFNRNQGEVAITTAEKIQAQRQREALEAEIKRDVALAFRSYRATAESLIIYSTQILPRSQDNLKSVQAAYQLGEFSTFDVINEQRRLIESETAYNEALRDYYAALAELERAIGASLPKSAFSSSMSSIFLDEKIFQLNVKKDK